MVTEIGYIIGNGLGLQIAALDKLHAANVASFATNGIGSLFDRTAWRPRYYFLSTVNYENGQRRAMYDPGLAAAEAAFVWDRYKEQMNGRNNVFFIDYRWPGDSPTWSPDYWSSNPLMWMSKYGTSLLPAAQMAMEGMKKKRLYFLGCDGYALEGDLHFEGYPEWADNFDRVKYGATLQSAHELIAHHAKRLGVECYLVGHSSIEAHQKIEYEDMPI
jgi:hypothetical protein